MEQQYNSAEAEKVAQQLWEQEQTYKTENGRGPIFSIDTPPPTVSGSLHIGHVFSYTQTDIIARYQRLCGYSIFYPMGFDDNGLPTERFVEKTHNVSSFQMGRSAFIELCLKQTTESEKLYEDLFKRLGLSIDWTKVYSSISPLARRISQESFIELYKKGFIYRKEEPALFCTACRTSVAQAELDDTEKPSTFNDIVFATEDGAELIISTTRPELLPSCVALFYHPTDQRYQHLENKKAHVPLFDIIVPIIADEHVTMDKGTGLVMCCTFGDKADIEWFKKHTLPYRPSIGRDGRMTDARGFLQGKKVPEARELVIQALKEKSLLRGQKAITHAVNIHERCKHEIEYLALPQWFLTLLPYKEKFIELGNQINWYPEFMKTRYVDWVEHLGWDWCLSRQRFYGIPFPVWHCATCKHSILADEKTLPIDPQETNPPLATCPHCGGTELIADTDVMDTWNTSSLSPFICRELYSGDKTTFIPMSMRPQAHDIIRTWAFYTIVKSWMHEQSIPWKKIVISGHVLTTQGQKISKSQANSPLIPENLLKLYPADVIRYWTASATLGYDVAFSETQLKIGNRLLIKLWNAFKFIEEHTKNVQTSTAHAVVGLPNEWILHQAHDTFIRYKNYFEKNEFGLALETAERFFWHDVCDNYLELTKDMLFNPAGYAPAEVISTQQTLAAIGMRILQLFAPFMPHITEVLYGTLYKSTHGTSSLHQTQFNDIQREQRYPETAETMSIILNIIANVRKLKSDHHLSLKADVQILTIMAQEPVLVEKIRSILTPHEALLKGITRAQEIQYKKTDAPETNSSLIQSNDTTTIFLLLSSS